jgi:2-polyprenyl-3-methyl-5-hydroxy-6-metoxy-1,4-benzoquinol methylase
MGNATVFGVVDFNKNCEAARNHFPLPVSGIPVYYHRCTTCGLIFTVRFDSFSNADFATHIYNADYKRVDPDYVEKRSLQNVPAFSAMFSKTPKISILDYGGGNGKLAGMLRLAGFADTATYDPFVPEFSKVPGRTFDLVFACEVMEHTPTPMQTLEQMISLRSEDGIIMFTTAIQPPNIEQIGLYWWYASPRNGHVTLYSISALQKLADRLNLKFATVAQNRHVMY